MFFHSNSYIASVAGTRLVHLVCEKCQTSFYYVLSRVGTGRADYILGKKSAIARAEGRAQRDLAKKLDREADMVPCPNCNWVNQNLIDISRKRIFRQAPILIAIILIIGTFFFPLVLSSIRDISSRQSKAPLIVSILYLMFLYSTPILILLIRRVIRLRINPNLTHPRPPVLPPGTPPALIEQIDPDTGKTVLLPVAGQSESIDPINPWVIFRPGQLVFPRICCQCLDPATTFYRSPLRVNEHSDLAVPLCRRCSTLLTIRWWLIVLLCCAVSCVLGLFLKDLPDKGDPSGRWFLFGFIVFFGTVFVGVIYAAHRCRPYRIKTVDAQRGIHKFAATNPAYTRLLIDQVRVKNGADA